MTAAAFWINRSALLARIAADPSPVILIEGPAGTGKSWLLRDLAGPAAIWSSADPPPPGFGFWDVPATERCAPLPERDAPLVLAKRPETAVPGLARAEVYGRVSRYGAEDLLFSEAEIEPALWAATGGWACLLPVAMGSRTPEGALVEFLREAILAPLPSAQLVALDLLLSGRSGAIPPDVRGGMPFATTPDGGLARPLAACRPHLDHALAALLAQRLSDPAEAHVIATMRARIGQITEAIAIFQSIGDWQAAIDTLRAAGGPFYIHRYGPAAFDRMIAGFPADLAAQDETLVLCRAVQAVKRGELPLTRRILIDRFGPLVEDSVEVIERRDLFSLEVRFIRMLLQTWEDLDLRPRYLDLSYRLLAEIGAQDDLRRGAFYNAVLEFYMRARRFPEAEDSAIRAASHFARAGVPILSFYIDLHRGVIDLMTGNPAAAARHAEAAAGHLARLDYDSPGDARILRLLRACIAYEQGAAEPLNRFLSLDLDSFTQGEIWPSMIEMILIYGSQAMAEHFSVMAARSFLDRWRVTEARSAQFGTLIDIREIAVLQSGNRWQEAMARASALPLPITMSFVESAGDGLAALSDRDEVALALVCLRHLAQHEPGRPGLDRLLAVMAENPHLTHRQRTAAELWLARVLRRQRRQSDAEARLRQTLETAARLGTIASLGEERSFLADLTGPRRLRDSLAQSDSIRRLLRQVADSGPGQARRGRAHGLTRQETRILDALAEGATNKAIGNLMGLSESTVKFHLANLYRKLGCGSRREAVAAARALHLVA